MHHRTRAFRSLRTLAVSAALCSAPLACSDGAAADGGSSSTSSCATEQLLGGWRGGLSLRACFAADGRMWIGDTEREVTGGNNCTYDPKSCRFECRDPDGGEPFTGTLTLSSGELLIEVVECPAAPDRCVAGYARDETIPCQ